MVGLLFFIYGAIFGSFYNVIIYRMPRDMEIINSRSLCPSCGKKIKAIDLIPILSWVFLKGKSRCCKEPIKPIYPIVEFVTGILFLLAYIITGGGIISIYYISFFSMLLIVGVIDLQNKVILDSILIVFFAIAVIIRLLFFDNVVNGIVAAAVAYTFYWFIYFVVKKIYKEERFGFGDVLYITVVAFYFGTNKLFLVLFGPFYVALAILLVLKALKVISFTLDDEIPFAPFISICSFLLSLIIM